MNISFGCPSCGHVMSIPAHRAGTRLYCTSCNSEFTAPALPGVPDEAFVCPSCGQAVEPAAQFCGQCGAVTAAGTSPGELFKRPAVVTLLAVLNGLGGLLLLPLGLLALIGGIGGDEPVAAVLSLVYLVFGGIQLAAAIGLWKLRPWGRALEIGLAIIGLLGFPVGTIISILILVYFFKPEVKLLFSGASPEALSQHELAQVVRASKSGSSIVTIIVVLVGLFFVCGVVSAIAIPNLLNAINRSRQKRSMADIRTIAMAAEAYAVDHRHYPIGAASTADLQTVLTPDYAVRLPATDGWRVPFDIRTAQDGTWYEIVSLGRDKTPDDRPGGRTTDFDCDIVYRNGSFVQYPEGIQVD